MILVKGAVDGWAHNGRDGGWDAPRRKFCVLGTFMNRKCANGAKNAMMKMYGAVASKADLKEMKKIFRFETVLS